MTAQALHIVSAAPDAVMTGGSGTPGALPFIALRERGYTKEIYGTPAIINPDFVRVGGAAVEGVIASTGPVVVADQLPDSYPTKKIALEYQAAYQKANNEPARGAFGPYAFDGWLVLLDSAKRALATGAQAGDAGIPRRFARRHGHRQGRRRHPRHLQLQAGRQASASTSARWCWSSWSTASGSWCSNV